MHTLWIAGAGGFGRELYHWIHAHPQHGVDYVFAGFIDDRPDALAGLNYPGADICPIDHYTPSREDRVLVGVGLPQIKKQIVRRLQARGAQFHSYIHPSAIIGGNVKLGRGCVLCPNAIVTADATLGDFVMLNLGAHVAHDSHVGDYVTLSPHANITGAVTVGQGAFFGVAACTIPGITIGEWSTLAAGAIAMRNIPPGATALGNPARVLPAAPQGESAKRRNGESAKNAAEEERENGRKGESGHEGRGPSAVGSASRKEEEAQP